MVWALAFIPVRQEQHDPRLLSPLRLTGSDELIDDRLRAVGEVTELGLPEDQCLRTRHRVAVLEAHRRVLTEQRIEDVELPLVLIQVLEGHPGFAGLAVHDRSEALYEGPATGVLSGEPDCASFQEQGAKSQDFRSGPVDRSLGDRRSPTL